MICCEPIQQFFSNALTSVVPYGPQVQAVHGVIPLVQVVYFTGGEYIISHDSTAVKYNNDNITVDHGGLASGIITVK